MKRNSKISSNSFQGDKKGKQEPALTLNDIEETQ